MNAPRFLSIAEVLELHAEQIELYGGEPGIRDLGLLESALAMPVSGINGSYFHDDLPAKAAAYLYHIVNNHPFIDGNKRTGLAAAYVFLALNGYVLESDPDELADMVLSVAEGRIGKSEAADFLRTHVTMDEA